MNENMEQKDATVDEVEWCMKKAEEISHGDSTRSFMLGLLLVLGVQEGRERSEATWAEERAMLKAENTILLADNLRLKATLEDFVGEDMAKDPRNGN